MWKLKRILPVKRENYVYVNNWVKIRYDYFIKLIVLNKLNWDKEARYYTDFYYIPKERRLKL